MTNINKINKLNSKWIVKKLNIKTLSRSNIHTSFMGFLECLNAAKLISATRTDITRSKVTYEHICYICDISRPLPEFPPFPPISGTYAYEVPHNSRSPYKMYRLLTNSSEWIVAYIDECIVCFNLNWSLVEIDLEYI